MLHPATQCPLAVYLCVYDVLIAAKAYGEVKCIRHGPGPHGVHGLAEESRSEEGATNHCFCWERQARLQGAGSLWVGHGT